MHFVVGRRMNYGWRGWGVIIRARNPLWAGIGLGPIGFAYWLRWSERGKA